MMAILGTAKNAHVVKHEASEKEHQGHDEHNADRQSEKLHDSPDHPKTRRVPWKIPRRKLDRFVYALAMVALVTLAVFFRRELGIMIVPVFCIILLLIVYEIREVEIHTERLILFVVIFLLFVSWGLLTLAEQNRELLDFKDSQLSPAVDELVRWSEARSLIQGAHISSLSYGSRPEGILIEDVAEWRTLTGPSMQPGIFPGNTVLLIPLEDGMAIREGQIVRVLNGGGNTYVHRVVAVYGNEIHTRGDNAADKEIVKREDVTHIVAGVLFT